MNFPSDNFYFILLAQQKLQEFCTFGSSGPIKLSLLLCYLPEVLKYMLMQLTSLSLANNCNIKSWIGSYMAQIFLVIQYEVLGSTVSLFDDKLFRQIGITKLLSPPTWYHSVSTTDCFYPGEWKLALYTVSYSFCYLYTTASSNNYSTRYRFVISCYGATDEMM